MPIRRLAGALARVTVSALFAGLFYTGWLAVFLGAFQDSGVLVKAVLWVVAPVITAAGFAVGMIIAERLTETRREDFVRTFAWPLFGCVLGAVVVVWLGPMLIVFGMFLVGTGSVALRELVPQTRARNG
jgi:hypothetical protein